MSQPNNDDNNNRHTINIHGANMPIHYVWVLGMAILSGAAFIFQMQSDIKVIDQRVVTLEKGFETQRTDLKKINEDTQQMRILITEIHQAVKHQR